MAQTHNAKAFSQAKELFFQGEHTQTQIANMVGVSQRTLYNWMQKGGWVRIRENAHIAPSVITENFISSSIELQNAIKARPQGQRYPTPQESITLTRLLAAINNLEKYPSARILSAAARLFHADDNLTSDSPITNRLNPYEANHIPYSEIKSEEEKTMQPSIQTPDNQQDEIISTHATNRQYSETSNEIFANNISNLQSYPQQETPVREENTPYNKKPTPLEVKHSIAKWFINRKLYPVGNKKVIGANASLDREITDEEWNELLRLGYREEELHNSLVWSVR